MDFIVKKFHRLETRLRTKTPKPEPAEGRDPRTVTVHPVQTKLEVTDTIPWITPQEIETIFVLTGGTWHKQMRGFRTEDTVGGQKLMIYQGYHSRNVTINYTHEPYSFTIQFGEGTPIAYETEPITHDFDGGEVRVEVSKLENGSYEIKLWGDIE